MWERMEGFDGEKIGHKERVGVGDSTVTVMRKSEGKVMAISR